MRPSLAARSYSVRLRTLVAVGSARTRDMCSDSSGLIAKLLRRQGVYVAGPLLALAPMVAGLWLALGLVRLLRAILDPGTATAPVAAGARRSLARGWSP